MRCKGMVALGWDCSTGHLHVVGSLLWAYGVTFMPCGIGLANKFQNSNKVFKIRCWNAARVNARIPGRDNVHIRLDKISAT